jgi:hypothetical protein
MGNPMHLPALLNLRGRARIVALLAAVIGGTAVLSLGAVEVAGSRPGGPSSATSVSAPTVAAHVASTALAAQPADDATADAPPAAAPGHRLSVPVPEGMRLRAVWLVDAAGTEAPPTSDDRGVLRFDGLPAATYRAGYQLETGLTAVDGAVVSTAQGAWTAPLAVDDGASIVVATGA